MWEERERGGGGREGGREQERAFCGMSSLVQSIPHFLPQFYASLNEIFVPGQPHRSLLRTTSMSSPPTLFTTLPSKLLHDKKIVIVMVGLPARGKSYISQKLKRWLCWMGYPTQVFNVGNYRRQKVKDSSDHHFFDHHDKEKNLMRDELALDVLESLLHWLKHEGGLCPTLTVHTHQLFETHRLCWYSRRN